MHVSTCTRYLHYRSRLRSLCRSGSLLEVTVHNQHSVRLQPLSNGVWVRWRPVSLLYLVRLPERIRNIIAKSVLLYFLLSTVLLRTTILTLKLIFLLNSLPKRNLAPCHIKLRFNSSTRNLAMQPQSSKFTPPALLSLERFWGRSAFLPAFKDRD
jgi:hypothetical protein